jgi:hypothetical protein
MPSAPTLHAISMLSLLGVTLAACALLLRRGERPRTFAGIVTALCAIVVVFLAAPLHLCNSGNPTFQALLGIVCVTALVVCVRGDRLAFALAGLVGIATFSLMNQYMALVHTERVTGNCRSYQNHRLEDLRTRAGEELLVRTPEVASAFPEGWLSDVDIVRKEPENCPLAATAATFHREEFGTWWHSWFTQIYELRKIPVALWYPGGTLVEAAGGLTWRERAGN